jgi:WD40 repeat protein
MIGGQVWSLDSPKSKYTLYVRPHGVMCLDFFSCDGQQYLITGSDDKTAKVINILTQYFYTNIFNNTLLIFE